MLESLYPIALPIHVTTAFSLIGLIVITDLYGLTWLTGKNAILNATWLNRIHTIVWGGLFILIMTGLVLFAPYQTYLLTHPPFLIKAGFILALVGNGIYIGKHKFVASTSAFAELPFVQKRNMLISGGISTTAWIGAFVAANFIS